MTLASFVLLRSPIDRVCRLCSADQSKHIRMKIPSKNKQILKDRRKNGGWTTRVRYVEYGIMEFMTFHGFQSSILTNPCPADDPDVFFWNGFKIETVYHALVTTLIWTTRHSSSHGKLFSVPGVRRRKRWLEKH